MQLQFKRKQVTVSDFAEASAIYSAARDKSGAGQRSFPMGTIADDSGAIIAYVSYNGRVWRDDPCARDWKPGKTPLHDPSVQRQIDAFKASGPDSWRTEFPVSS